MDDPFVVGFDEVGAVGAQALERDPHRFERLADAVKPDDVATLVYTSGTTGPPKGAEVTHANIMWVMRAAIPFIHCTRGERFLSFLPLSHVAERMISDFASVAVTGETWFARSLSTVVEDLGECRPTIFFAVPRVWEKLYEAVLARLGDSPPVLEFVVQRYIQLGRQVTARRQARTSVPLWEDLALRGLDAAIGSRIRQQLGLDKAHILASSAAPVSPDLLRWLHAVGLPVIELYGQTEACGPSTCNPPEDIRIGTVGVPIPGVLIEIASDGEVLVRGGNVCRGYFRDPESTAELIDADGWMHTGDIGQVDADGYLTITGRKKDLIITAAGQNISPQEIEEDLRHNGLISEAVVVGEGRRYLTALVTLDEEAVVPWARRHGKVADYEALVSDPDLHAEVDRTIESVNQRHAHVENIRKYRVLPHEIHGGLGGVHPHLQGQAPRRDGALRLPHRGDVCQLTRIRPSTRIDERARWGGGRPRDRRRVAAPLQVATAHREGALRELRAAAAGARTELDGVTVWNVNSTAAGGGVAEILQVLVGYSRDAGVDARGWCCGATPTSTPSPSGCTTACTGSPGTRACWGPRRWTTTSR